MAERHTQGRVMAGTIPVTINNQLSQFHAVGIEGTPTALALTGVVGDERDALSSADARRIAACWNYCESLDTNGMELAISIARPIKTFIDESIKKELELTAQRDQLLEALRELIGAYADKPCARSGLMDLLVTGEDINKARSAIANTTEGSTAPQSADYKKGFRDGMEYQERVEVDLLEALIKAKRAQEHALEVVRSYEEGGECSESGQFILEDLASIDAAIAKATGGGEFTPEQLAEPTITIQLPKGAIGAMVSRNGTTAKFYPVKHLPADDTEGGAA